MYSSSIGLSYDQKSTHSHQGPSKLTRLLRRGLQRRPEDEITGSAYLPYRPAESLESCVSNFPNEAETFDNKDMTWSRPSSRTSHRPHDQHASPAPQQGDYAEMLDDENSAWMRPSKSHRRTRRS